MSTTIDIVVTDYGAGSSGMPLSPSRVARALNAASIGRELRAVVIVDAATGLTATYRTDGGVWSASR